MLERLTNQLRVSDREQGMDMLIYGLCFLFVVTGLLFSVPFYVFYPPTFSALIGLFISFLLMTLAEIIGPRRKLAIIGARDRPAIVKRFAPAFGWIVFILTFLLAVIMFLSVFVGIEKNADMEFIVGLCALSVGSLWFLVLTLRRLTIDERSNVPVD